MGVFFLFSVCVGGGFCDFGGFFLFLFLIGFLPFFFCLCFASLT